MGWATAVAVVIVAYLCSTFDDLTEFAELRQAKKFWTNLLALSIGLQHFKAGMTC